MAIIQLLMSCSASGTLASTEGCAADVASGGARWSGFETERHCWRSSSGNGVLPDGMRGRLLRTREVAAAVPGVRAGRHGLGPSGPDPLGAHPRRAPPVPRRRGLGPPAPQRIRRVARRAAIQPIGLHRRARRAETAPKPPVPRHEELPPDSWNSSGAVTRPAAALTRKSSIRRRTRRPLEAKRVCSECSVQGTCLEFALQGREKEGVWGGATEKERRRILRQRRRASVRAAGRASAERGLDSWQ